MQIDSCEPFEPPYRSEFDRYFVAVNSAPSVLSISIRVRGICRGGCIRSGSARRTGHGTVINRGKAPTTAAVAVTVTLVMSVVVPCEREMEVAVDLVAILLRLDSFSVAPM